MPFTRREVRRLLSFATEIKQKKIYLLIFAVSLAHLGSGVLVGFVPTLSTNYFVSTLEDGNFAECVDQEEGEEPRKVCKDAHTMAVVWDAGKMFVSSLFLAVVFNAFVQRYSAVYGRKLFLMFALIFALIPPILVLLHLQANVPFYWFYLAKAVELSFSLSSVSYAYLMDLVEETSTDMVYVVYLSAVSFSSFVGALLVVTSVLEDVLHAVIFTLVCIGVSVAFVLCFVPESVAASMHHNSFRSSDETQTETNRIGFDLWVRPFQEMYTSFRVFLENERLVSVLCVYTLFEFINQRNSELELQYLQEVAGFGTREQSLFLMIRFLVSCFVYAVFFPLWTLVFMKTYKDALGLGFVMAAVKLFGMIFVRMPWLAYVLEACGAADAIVNLIIYRVMEHHCQSVQPQYLTAAIMGIRSIAQGLSPVFHALLFPVFRHTDIYIPGLPFVSLFVFAFIGFVQVLNIRVEKYGFPMPSSTFLRLVTLTFLTDEEEFDDCINSLAISGRGYYSEEDTNSSESSEDPSTPAPQIGRSTG